MLPEPSDFLQQRSYVLQDLLFQKIEENSGWISFEHYMDQALYTPEYGYYAGGMEKIGSSGDFVTAPMLGKLFARCLAKQCIEVFQGLPLERERLIVEFGAGTGQLACDIIDEIKNLGEKIDRYLILEVSAELRARQYKIVHDHDMAHLEIVTWAEKLPGDGFCGIVIANELLDAFPVRRFEVNNDGLAVELGVVEKSKKFAWQSSELPLDSKFQARLQGYALSPGYRSEVGMQAEAWVRTVGEKLIAGSLIIIDYGFSRREFFHPDRSDGTLMCHYQHRAHSDPFFYPGLQDITAHVDFSAIKQAGQDIGLDLTGYATQGGFLLSLGILDELMHYQNESNYETKEVLELSQQVKKLTLPHEMGEIFKVIALSRNVESLSGFTLQNHMSRL